MTVGPHDTMRFVKICAVLVRALCVGFIIVFILTLVIMTDWLVRCYLLAVVRF